ncbi:ribosome maturation factor RimM [Inconstantimicrobium mannanitabidum]|uniref:Ribosome maturation factor RimM n=1 Tax=Inconstantimicrobium mannanitabidum TaxID=1604901 RepID=A0ACB5RBY4_9CLOT|nr:ribosome maturation factor RimM [Clostridium sp. TW13]GKX66287.1 ribosome maturation factor RimM [Clostridium sp. TW13]
MKKQFLNIGKVVNTHGVKGEVKVIPLTEDMRRFDELEEVLIGDETYAIDGCKYQKDRVILKIRGIDSIDDTAKIRNKYITIPRDQAIVLPEDTYFISDLIGCKVEDTDGFQYGKVYDVIQTGSNDVYWVKGNKEILVPVLKEIVLDINIDSELIVIKPSGEWQDED